MIFKFCTSCQFDKKTGMTLNYTYQYKKIRKTNMLSILINLIFVSSFCFLLIMLLEYIIYLWENKKVTDLTKHILPDREEDLNPKFEFTKSNTGIDSLNNPYMKNPINNKYFERSIVLVKSQDYRKWSEKTLEVAKKVAGNIGLYSQKAIKFVLNLSKSGNNFPDHEEKHIKTIETNDKIKETVAKINLINEEEDQKIVKISQDINFEDIDKSLIIQSTNEKESESSMENTQTKDTTTYDKIEKSILQKLQEVGLNHYDIWLELGQFYQKYDEKQKAKEIFAMVMKHAQGKDKELARDGLIALS
jgi:hypothetical protein